MDTRPLDLESPRVGVAVLLVKQGRILLNLRIGPHGGGTWAPPGGHLDFGESPQDCARREVLEEVGLRLRRMRFLAITNDIFRENGRHYITIWMAGDSWQGRPRLAAPEESSRVEWHPLTGLPEPLFLPFRQLLEGRSLPPLDLLQEFA